MYKIRKAVLEDASGIAEVHVCSWKETYKKILPLDYLNNLKVDEYINFWKSVLLDDSNYKWTYVIVNNDNEIAGFISGGKSRYKNEEYEGELYAIYILKKYQKKNLGNLLFQKLKEKFLKEGIETIIVMVLSDNPSKGFYVKHGAKFIKDNTINVGGSEIIESIYGFNLLDK